MELIVKQAKLTFFGDQFEIFEADQIIYSAESVLFSFPKKILVYDTENVEKITLIKALTWIHPEFKIIYSGGANLSLEGKSWFYDYFVMRVPEGTFEIHHQKGLRLSIFLITNRLLRFLKTL